MNARLILKQLPNLLIFRILHYSQISQQLRDELVVSAGSLRLKGRGSKALEWQPFVLWLANLIVCSLIILYRGGTNLPLGDKLIS